MSWIIIKDKYPPRFKRLLVLKQYIVEPISFVDIDQYLGPAMGWNGGGIVTHWMPLPEMPISSQPYEKT